MHERVREVRVTETRTRRMTRRASLPSPLEAYANVSGSGVSMVLLARVCVVNQPVARVCINTAKQLLLLKQLKRTRASPRIPSASAFFFSEQTDHLLRAARVSCRTRDARGALSRLGSSRGTPSRPPPRIDSPHPRARAARRRSARARGRRRSRSRTPRADLGG